MDLNKSYFQHQMCLMQARASISRLERTRHLAKAGAISNRIRDYQLPKGAGAASYWLRNMDPWAFESAPVTGSRE
jgi:hypothetical protein